MSVSSLQEIKMDKRKELIIEYIKDKDVLDIGSVGQYRKYNLFNFLESYCNKLQGIDIQVSNKRNIVMGDMEVYKFGKEFDVVIASELIEHIDNQGMLLDNIKLHLKDNGILILTTPNAKWFTVMLKPNPTHTIWHDRYTLNYMLSKKGFEIIKEYYYCGNKESYPFWLKPFIARQQLLVVCKKRIRRIENG